VKFNLLPYVALYNKELFIESRVKHVQKKD
jgi:hypothetical protein